MIIVEKVIRRNVAVVAMQHSFHGGNRSPIGERCMIDTVDSKTESRRVGKKGGREEDLRIDWCKDL